MGIAQEKICEFICHLLPRFGLKLSTFFVERIISLHKYQGICNFRRLENRGIMKQVNLARGFNIPRFERPRNFDEVSGIYHLMKARWVTN